MRSKHAFEELISESVSELTACWRLVDPNPKVEVQNLLDFQPQLLRVLQRLEIEYQAIARNRQSLIKRKVALNPRWFRMRQGVLAKRQEVLRDTILIGRTLGDSFAWPFYRNEERLLSEHAKQEPVATIPVGVGGQGELGLISSLKGFDGLFVLHHGITTILRLGDISLVDLTRLRVVGIGELKSARASDSEISVDIIFAAIEERAASALRSAAALVTPQRQVSPSTSLTSRMQARLQRQLRRTANAFLPPEQPVGNRSIQGPEGSYVPELAKAIESAKHGRWTTHAAGQGLLFACYRCQSRSIAARSRELGSRAPRLISNATESLFDMQRLVIDGSRHNALITGSPFFRENGWPHETHRSVPLIWRELDRELYFRIVTHDTCVISIYNPAHLLEAFRKHGWEIDGDGPPDEIVLRRRAGDRMQELHGLRCFVYDVSVNLHTEQQVAFAVSAAMEGIKDSDVSVGTRIQLDIRHVLPPDRRRRASRSNLAEAG